MSDESAQDPEFRFQKVGEQLKAARENKGMSLNDVALRTRVPLRHLEAIELGNFAALPGITYSVGFAKAFAGAVDLDETKIATELRAELANDGISAAPRSTPSYEPADPARVPPRAFAWIAAGIAVFLLAGYFVWRTYAFGPAAAPVADESVAAAADEKTATQTAPEAATPDAKGQVTLTATDTVWVRVYGADRKRLYEKEMAAGDKFDVPADANGPMINTGRPQALKVTIGGVEVPALGETDRAISDVGVSAAALLARAAPAATTATGSGGAQVQATPKAGQ